MSAECVLTALKTTDDFDFMVLIQVCKETNAIAGARFTTWLICERLRPRSQ